MASFDVITDSTSDLTSDLRQEYNIDYFRMGFSSGDKEYSASLDWDEIGSHEFYDSMRNGVKYKTSQVSVKTFTEKLKKHLSAGQDVIYIACSSALSSSVKTAYVVRDELKKDFPDRKVICVDSLISGMSQGMLAIECARMASSGKSIEECEEWIEANFFGNLFAVKPIIISDTMGQNLAIEKVKGRKSSFTAIAEHIAEYIISPEKQTIWIGHADCFFDAEALELEIRNKIPNANIKKYVIGPIVGVSVGPGTLICNYTGKAKSEQLENTK